MGFGKSEMYAVKWHFYQEGDKTAGSSNFVTSGSQEKRFSVLKGEEGEGSGLVLQ